MSISLGTQKSAKIPPAVGKMIKPFINFLWICWFLGKNLYNFVSPIWKIHNPYCHIESTYSRCQLTSWKKIVAKWILPKIRNWWDCKFDLGFTNLSIKVRGVMDIFDSCNSCQFWEKVYRLDKSIGFFISKEMHLYSSTSMQDWLIDM